jgi:hypothetical protein
MATTGTKIINSPVDLKRNELRNAIFQNLAAAPGSPLPGLYYYDTALSAGYVWNGTAWRPMDAGKLTDGSVAIAALAVNPLARANHTGTQVAATISDLATTVKAYTLDSFAAPVAALNINGQKLTSVAAGVAGTDAVNVTQMNTAIQSSSAGISGKGSVVAVSTTNVASMSGTAVVVDGVTLNTVGMRVLLTGQTTTSQNGPWVVAAGAWTRPTTDATNELETGALWFVEQGTVNAASQWWLNSPVAGVTITPGTTAIGIVKFGASASYTAGTNGGLQLVGSAFSVLLPAGSGLVEDATGLHLDPAVGVKKYTNASVGDGTNSVYTFTHNLGTKLIVCSLINNSTGDIEDVCFNAASTTTVTLTFGAVVAAAAYSLVVVG